MTYQVLARKWRPKNFSQMVGQTHVVQALVNGLDQDRLHHAFLLTGTRGVGKTTLARIFAKCLNCEQGVSSTPCDECAACVDIDAGRFVDMLEVDAASRTKVDDTREILENVQYAPTRGRYKVYIIDEVHMLSTASFNALLKTLEEPPEHVKFVLATTDPQKIPVTVLSRCLRFNLTRLEAPQIQQYLQKLLQAEAIEAEDEAVLLLARAADGSMRDGLSLLDQAIGFGGGKVTTADVSEMLGSLAHDHIVKMLTLLFAGDASGLLAQLDEQARYSIDFDRLLQQLAESLHRIALIQQLPDYSDENRPGWEALRQLSGQVDADAVQLYYQIAIHGRRDLRLAPDPHSGTEMTFLRLLAFQPADNGGAQPAKAGSATAKPTTSSTAVTGQAASMVREPAPITETPAVARAVVEVAPITAIDYQQLPWNQMIEKLELRGANLELARNVENISRQDDIWKFVIADHLEHLAGAQTVLTLKAAISRLLGAEVIAKVATSTASKCANKAVELQTPAAESARQQDDKMSRAEQAINADPTVQSLQQEMDASIIDGSTKSLQ